MMSVSVKLFSDRKSNIIGPTSDNITDNKMCINALCTLGVIVRNMKMDFNTGGTNDENL